MKGKIDRIADRLHRIAFAAEDKHAVHPDAVLMKAADAFSHIFHALLLVKRGQGVRVNRFKSHIDHVPAGAPHQFKQLRIPGRFRAHLGAPSFQPYIVVDHPLKELLAPHGVGGKIVVAKKYAAAPVSGQLPQDAFRAAKAVAAPEHESDAAESAIEGATPGGHYRNCPEWFLPFEEREIGKRKLIHLHRFR